MSGIPSVLFVCLGNICRSPTAEAVFRKLVNDQNMEVKIDSAGTGGWNVGAKPDKRSLQVGVERGYDFTDIRCRKVRQEDFSEFDYIVPMDSKNVEDLIEICPDEHQHKIKLLMHYAPQQTIDIPDPYYGGKAGFSVVMNMIEAGCNGLVQHIQTA